MNSAKKEAMKTALVKSIPVFFSYIFLGIAYGIMMEEAGYNWLVSGFASTIVFTGAFQFVLISFLSTGASLATIALTGLLMASRQTFYSLTFLNDFNSMGRRKWYMVYNMSDETYAVNCTLKGDDETRKEIMYWVARFSKSYWVIGSILGGVIGQLIPFDMSGIDFCMTAVFIIIFIDQWENAVSHIPAITGAAASIICLLIFGQTVFLLPSLLIISAILIIVGQKKEVA